MSVSKLCLTSAAITGLPSWSARRVQAEGHRQLVRGDRDVFRQQAVTRRRLVHGSGQQRLEQQAAQSRRRGHLSVNGLYLSKLVMRKGGTSSMLRARRTRIRPFEMRESGGIFDVTELGIGVGGPRIRCQGADSA